MSENVRPRGGGGAADDLLAALSGRVRELQTKLASMQADLEESQRRLATYEEFDGTLQDALSGALRAAYEIRTRSEDTANQLLEQAREERRVLMKEVQRLRDERDSLQDEIATLRRGGIAAVPRPAPAPEPTSAADLKAAAAEAMRSIFDEIVQEMRGRAAAAEPPRPAAQPAPQAAPAPQIAPAPPMQPAPRPQAVPVERPLPPAAVTPAARPQAESRPEPEPARADDLSAALAKQFAPEAPTPPAVTVSARAAPAPRPVLEPPAPGPVAVERPMPVPTVPEHTAASAEPVVGASMEVQLVLSPVPSFPRLVEIERRIQSLPGVRTLYVRDFRNGVATLAVGLRSAMTAEEFASTVQTLESPRFLLESVARNSVELRIDGEAATA